MKHCPKTIVLWKIVLWCKWLIICTISFKLGPPWSWIQCIWQGFFSCFSGGLLKCDCLRYLLWFYLDFLNLSKQRSFNQKFWNFWSSGISLETRTVLNHEVKWSGWVENQCCVFGNFGIYKNAMQYYYITLSKCF